MFVGDRSEEGIDDGGEDDDGEEVLSDKVM